MVAEPVQELSETLKFLQRRKAVDGLVNVPRAWWTKVNQVMAHLGWIASSLPLLIHEQRRTNPGPLLCFAHVDDVLVALNDSKSETRQHCDALKRQFQWISWEDADFTISGVHFRQDFVHNRWREIFLDQHDYAHVIESLHRPSSARDDQPLTPWEI